MSVLFNSMMLTLEELDIYWAYVKLLLHFDGNLTDQRGHIFTASGGAATSSTQSKWGGQSLYLNGSTQYISAADSTDWQFGQGDFTVEGWLYSGSIASDQMVIEYANTGNQGWYVRVESSKLFIALYDTSSTVVTITGITTMLGNTWYYYKLYRLGTTLYLYLNNNLEGSVANPNKSYQFANSILRIGATTAASPGLFFNGYIDDPRITKGIARSGATMPTGPFPNK